MSPFLTHILIRLIQGYQKTLSPDHSPLRAFFPHGVCRYQPTCSEYIIQAITRYGWHGFRLGVQRIARCHPFAPGGHDSLPTTL